MYIRVVILQLERHQLCCECLLQEAVVLSLFVSCMTKLFNSTCIDITEEIFSDYTALWPTALPL